jgi:hypothetical protein
MRKPLKNIPSRARFALAGLGFIAIGAWMIYPPSAFIVVGAALLAEAVTSTPAAPVHQPKEKK